MSFRPLLARAGAAAAAGAAVLGQPAQARAPPITGQQHQQQVTDAKSPFEDEWTLAQFDQGDVVFLRPEEVNQAADEFRHATYGMRAFDDHDETSSNDSDERRATEVIELSESMHRSAATQRTAYVNGDGVTLLLDLATEMLKRPAVQQEVMSIIADNPHLHRALLAPPPPTSPGRLMGPQQFLLLDAPPSPLVEEIEDEGEGSAGARPQANDAWHALLTNLQQTLAAMGSQLGGLRARLAHWLRVLLLGQRSETVQPDQPPAAAAAGGLLPPPGQVDGMHPFLRAAMAVAVVLACVAVARRPGMAAGIIALAAKRSAARK